ncbi:hypothetical protein RBA41_05810 [Massilia sp. CCM 9210]|uniref:hypothetical protein n=1 Tax=Massilia scottii TaxID=3057166 RepID=UPI00279699A6|nr:hypothetical protein [Massilia sp. CCM 9210]MDQ1812816.1 hypothetical protein [Massilia sp. CCM 9210]
MAGTDLNAPAVCFSVLQGLLYLFFGVGRARHLSLRLSSPKIRLSSDNQHLIRCERPAYGVRQDQAFDGGIGHRRFDMRKIKKNGRDPKAPSVF